MPNEVSITKNLSGPESLDACLAELRAALIKDDRFAPHMGYPGFRAVIDFKCYPHQSYIPDIERVVEVTEGQQEGLEAEPVVNERVEIPVRPPNQVREEAGLPQPVLVTDGKGQSHEEWVKRGKAPTQGKVPHNKVKGL